DVDPLVALLSDRAQHGSAVGNRLNRLVGEVDEKAVDVESSHAVARIGLHPDNYAAQRLRLQQSPALGLRLWIRTEIDLRRLEGVADVAVHRHGADRSARVLPDAPRCTDRSGEAIDVLRTWEERAHASAVDANGLPRLVRRVPAHPSQQARARRQL